MAQIYSPYYAPRLSHRFLVILTRDCAFRPNRKDLRLLADDHVLFKQRVPQGISRSFTSREKISAERTPLDLTTVLFASLGAP
jgi:hypothetical protein